MQILDSHKLVSPQTAPLRCWAEVDFSAVRKNLAVAQNLCQDAEPRVLAVVKADAYGHGAARVARALSGQVRGLAVATLSEALEARSVVEDSVYLLSPSLPDERPWVIQHGFVPVLSSVDEAKEYDLLAARANKKLRVQLVVDTGMGRIGFLPEEAMDAAARLAVMNGIQVESIASHFPSADENSESTVQQAATFRQLVKALVQRGLRPEFVHVANSAGLLGYPHEPREVIRAGLMLYGVSPLPRCQPLLVPALSWKARVSLVRNLPTGWGISYGSSYVTPRPMRIATVAAGYGDGYPRHLSRRGTEVLIRGRRCPVVGRITMDQILVDTSSVPESLEAGETAVLLGRQGQEEITASELAQKAGTIPWEILTRISSRVPRL